MSRLERERALRHRLDQAASSEGRFTAAEHAPDAAWIVEETKTVVPPHVLREEMSDPRVLARISSILSARPDLGVDPEYPEALPPPVVRKEPSEKAVDGAGLSPAAHAEVVASRLSLGPAQAGTLAAELRNALVPARAAAEKGWSKSAVDSIDRALLLVRAVVSRAGKVEKLAEVATEAAAVHADREAAFEAERAAAARVLTAAVEAARPALPSVCERSDWGGGMQIALVGGRSPERGERFELHLALDGRFLEARYLFLDGAWCASAFEMIDLAADVVERGYKVEQVVAALLRLCEAQAASKGSRLRAGQARARAGRLSALAGLVEALCVEVPK